MTDREPSQVAGAAKEEGSQVASTAVDQGRQTASAAADAGSQVAGAGIDGARQVATDAAQQAGEVTRLATDQARDLVEQAQSQLREQAGTQAQKAAGGLRDVSSQVRALSEGRADQAGIAADGARQLAQKIDTLAARIDERGFDGTVEDLRDLARRRPGLFLLGAAAAGFAVSRLGRGLQVVQEQESSPAPRAATAPAGPLGDPEPVPAGPTPNIGGW